MMDFPIEEPADATMRLLRAIDEEAKARGLSQSEAMKQIGLTRSALAHWRRGGSMRPATMAHVRGWLGERAAGELFAGDKPKLAHVLREARHLVGREYDKKSAAVARRLIDTVAMLATRRIDLAKREEESAARGSDEGSAAVGDEGQPVGDSPIEGGGAARVPA